MSEIDFTAPSAADLQAIQQEAERLRAQALAQIIRACLTSLSRAMPRNFSLSPSCARPLH